MVCQGLESVSTVMINLRVINAVRIIKKNIWNRLTWLIILNSKMFSVIHVSMQDFVISLADTFYAFT
jgi:hypothetical protein